ncbi:hypothetical protein WAF17_04145 [Bernardetia sp. ABR2-2B]|uniref:DUF6000 family protein n=1 Tax=Bernardetia sp. ABR2-2B TaxID=3127472 RepID=UPI0030CEAF00
MTDKEYDIITEIVAPIYLDIFSLCYCDDMDEEEEAEFFNTLEKIVNRPNLKDEVRLLFESFEIDNWRIRIVLSWLSAVFDWKEFQPDIASFITKHSRMGNSVYLYVMLEFNNEQSIKSMKKFIDEKAENVKVDDPYGDVHFAEQILLLLQEDINSNKNITEYLLDLKKSMLKIRRKLNIDIK